jgi:hypothetical protein
MYVQSKLSKQTQTKTKQEKLNGGKSLPVHAPAQENKPLNPEAPRASEQPDPPNHGEKTRFAALTRDPNRKPPQAREGHAPITERPHNRGERLEHQRLTTNTVDGRVSTRRRRKLVDLASKNLTVNKHNLKLRHRHAMGD